MKFTNRSFFTFSMISFEECVTLNKQFPVEAFLRRISDVPYGMDALLRAMSWRRGGSGGANAETIQCVPAVCNSWNINLGARQNVNALCVRAQDTSGVETRLARLKVTREYELFSCRNIIL